MVRRIVKSESITAEDFSKELKRLRNRQFRNYEPSPTSIVSNYVYLYQDKRDNYHIIFRDYLIKKVRHLIMDPYTGEKDPTLVDRAGWKAYMRMKKFCDKYKETVNFEDNDNYRDYKWIPFEFADKHNYNKVLEHCYEYDSNSNYLSKFKMPLPYGGIVRNDDYVGEGEIGFNMVYNSRHEPSIVSIFKGKANIIFKTQIYKGLCEFADFMYSEKLKITDEEEKDRWKTIICAAHGNLKNHNIFMATAIIGYSKREILKYSEFSHVYMNTVDSIVCDSPIPNIPLGNGLGEFKLVHENMKFKYKSQGIKYWENGDIKHKGLKRSRLDENGNLKPLKYKIINKELVECQNLKED